MNTSENMVIIRKLFYALKGTLCNSSKFHADIPGVIQKALSHSMRWTWTQIGIDITRGKGYCMHGVSPE